ncbi:MAG: SDR family NAD(P)-dependent oxidoreductase [FCB group bacterium]|nr:SDR family NAD(P)-dependent oxidoreductase [FCB group bacterium]MBL7028840.1 SDR family NAD(P)-dependent oxidoreductase [Candidatus Neomarinimicrobiota bacterium]MBL7121705.1 SDR family NAD(P)-dependent oxidoreductase [Candidatus Neomarinimicrobiota bacterium]
MYRKVAIVTGANRGLGHALTKSLAEDDYKVFMVGRNKIEIDNASAKLQEAGLDIEGFEADVSKARHITALSSYVSSQFDHLDLLINNAGVIVEPGGLESQVTCFTINPELVEEAFSVNTVGALRLVQAFYDLLKKARQPRVVNVSSGMGSIAHMEAGWPAYRMSKAAMNALTVILAKELVDTRIKVNSVDPGWVRTDMGGPNADRSIEEGIEGILWAAKLPPDGPTGGFYKDGKLLDW